MGRRMNSLRSNLTVKLLSSVILFSAVLFSASGCMDHPLAGIIGTAEISVSCNGESISADGTFSFGEVLAGSTRPEMTFTIKNDGKTSLVLPSGVEISGTNAVMFPLIDRPAYEIEPGGTSVFVISFEPYGSGGEKNAKVSIKSNDVLAGTFEFSLRGIYSGVSVYLTTSLNNPTNVSPIPVNISFSESVTDFTSSDLIITNGHVSSFQQSGLKDYIVNITAEEDGEVSVMVPEGAAYAEGTSHSNIESSELSLFYDGTSPANGSVLINGGALGTNYLENVVLTLNCNDGAGTGVEDMRISNTADFTNMEWEDFSTSRTWDLDGTTAEGESTTVYARFRDFAGNESVVYSCSVIYDTIAPDPPSEPDLEAEDDSGDFDDDDITRQSTSLTFSGTAEAGSTVKIYSHIDGLAGSGECRCFRKLQRRCRPVLRERGQILYIISAPPQQIQPETNPAIHPNWRSRYSRPPL